MDKQNSYYLFGIKSNIRICFTAMIIGLSAISSIAQKRLIPEKYLKITPAVSTREDVEKLFGKGDPNSDRITYQIPDITIIVQYSFGDCSKRARIWAISEGIVEYVYYSFRENEPRLKDILLEKSKFKKREVGDVIGQFEYYNDESGISVIYLKGEKRVADIIIEPTLKQKKRFACSTNKQ